MNLCEEVLKHHNVKESTDRFLRFCDLLLEKNKVMNLTAITEPDEVYVRHFSDCLALLDICDFKGKRVIDIGCGAGFPGIPLKLAEKSIELTLLDSLGKRVDFLREVCAELSLTGVSCIHARAEDRVSEEGFRESFDIAVSRAVADLSVLSELSLPYVKRGGFFIAMKSKNCEEELAAAERAISVLGAELYDRVDYPLFGSGITHTALVFKKTRETPKRYPRRFAKIKSAPIK